MNDGNGAFTKQHRPPIDVGWPAFELVAVDVNANKNIDVNEDGKVDIAASSFGSSAVALLLGR